MRCNAFPKDANLLGRLVDAGGQVARLLDANRNAREVVEAVLTPERAKMPGRLRRLYGANVSDGDLKLTITYWSA